MIPTKKQSIITTQEMDFFNLLSTTESLNVLIMLGYADYT